MAIIKSWFNKQFYPSHPAIPRIFIVALCGLILAAGARAQEVSFAGFAFAGDHAQAAQRFPYAYKVDQSLKAAGTPLTRQVIERVYAEPDAQLKRAALDKLASLKGSDQTLLSVLLFTGETVSTEQFGSYVKTFVNLRGDAVIFDFKTKTIVRNYPISVILFDAGTRQPTPAELEALVRDLLVRADSGGLMTQYVKRITAATLPRPATRTMQIKPATVTPEALALLPAALRDSPALASQVLSEAFGAVLSAKLGVSLLPTGMGGAMGAMSFRLDNGDAYDFKVGEGDYLFDVGVNKFVKVKAGESGAGTSFAYGVYGNVRFYEPLTNTDYFRSDIKNGEVKLVPAGQVSVDDAAAYEAALRGLYLKFAAALQPQADTKWITTAAADKNVLKQIDSTRDILKASK
ncbi:hypothetical protein [Massilia sp. CF038]|uniref:hypothetical protein n=1 Tax=Massilia sp. CF038 TaxID=1881045 RepID=UPI00091018CE|nr:hypothetical protein [Massilia sp. CF038]SHH05145.1 hypothetical protein SAMN05428948_2518 [Massilia sp. CF038]